MPNPNGVNRCQLCEPNYGNGTGPLPKAVAKYMGWGVCAHHDALVKAIASDAATASDRRADPRRQEAAA